MRNTRPLNQTRVMLDLERPLFNEERSIIFRVKRETLAVDNVIVLRDRHIDAGAAFSID